MSPKTNGAATFKNLGPLYKWFNELDAMAAAEAEEKFCAIRTEYTGSFKEDHIHSAIHTMFSCAWWKDHLDFESLSRRWEETKVKTINGIRKFRDFCETYEQIPQVGFWADGEYAFLHLGNAQKGIVIPHPEKYLVYGPPKDYSNFTVAQVRAQLNAPMSKSTRAIIPTEAESLLTQDSLHTHLKVKEQELGALDKEMDDVKKARTGELAELQKQMEAIKQELEDKQAALLAELDNKKQELEQAKEQLEGQIYLLDSQIYAIRCFAGDTVKFGQLRKGANALDTEPIIVHQKLRFLDEDLGRLASLYEIQWEDIGLFEEFLKHSPVALDTFAPNERCIVLVRLSRTGKQQGRDENYPYGNLLTDFRYYHGTTVGIIIRNGENLYLGWTDEDRVHISDDLIISQIITDVAPVEQKEFLFESEKKQYEAQQKKERRQILDGLISRNFVYNILQGVVEHTPILPLPPGVTLGKQSEHVIYAVADTWLSDNRFGSFTDIVKRCNERVTKGDSLLVVQHLIPEGSSKLYAKSWENPRGRGEMNRTHDCHVEDCTIYLANLIEYDDPERMVRYRHTIYPGKTPNPNAKPYKCEDTILKKHLKNLLASDLEILDEFDYRKRHVFVSVKKTHTYTKTYEQSTARANFELYEEEYINLTYMNSVWLEWVITNKSLGGWQIAGHSVDYAYAIRYLKTAMDFVRAREAKEKELIDAIDSSVCKDKDWPLNLTEWKLENSVREITEYQAKRFVQAQKS